MAAQRRSRVDEFVWYGRRFASSGLDGVRQYSRHVLRLCSAVEVTLMKKRIFLIAVLTCLLLPTLSLAAAPPATGTNWLQSVTSQVDALTTTHGDALVDMGVTELNFI